MSEVGVAGVSIKTRVSQTFILILSCSVPCLQENQSCTSLKRFCNRSGSGSRGGDSPHETGTELPLAAVSTSLTPVSLSPVMQLAQANCNGKFILESVFITTSTSKGSNTTVKGGKGRRSRSGKAGMGRHGLINGPGRCQKARKRGAAGKLCGRLQPT